MMLLAWIIAALLGVLVLLCGAVLAVLVTIQCKIDKLGGSASGEV